MKTLIQTFIICVVFFWILSQVVGGLIDQNAETIREHIQQLEQRNMNAIEYYDRMFEIQMGLIEEPEDYYQDSSMDLVEQIMEDPDHPGRWFD